jgi:hypothetical protein
LSEGKIEIWDMACGQYHNIPTGTHGDIGNLQLSAEGKLLLVVTGEYRIGKLGFWQQVKQWLGLDSAAAADPLSNWIFEQHIRVVDTVKGAQLAHLPNRTRGIFTPDGTAMAILGEDQIEFWDLPIAKPWAKIVAIGCSMTIISALVLGATRHTRLFWRKRFSPWAKSGCPLP